MSLSHEEEIVVYRVRPRFQIETSMSADEILTKIKSGLSSPNASCRGEINHGYATLFLPPEEQHYWSPQLSLNMEELEEGTLLRGLYGPRPGVWTMFVFFYAIIAFAIVIIGVIGLSNLSLDESGAILWGVPILLLIFLTLYLVAYTGQKMARGQMNILHDFLEESTGLKF